VEKEIRNEAKIRDVVVEVGKIGIMINNILELRGFLSGYSHLAGGDRKAWSEYQDGVSHAISIGSITRE